MTELTIKWSTTITKMATFTKMKLQVPEMGSKVTVKCDILQSLTFKINHFYFRMTLSIIIQCHIHMSLRFISPYQKNLKSHQKMNLLFSSKIDFPDRFRIRYPVRASRGQDVPVSGWPQTKTRRGPRDKDGDPTVYYGTEFEVIRVNQPIAERHWTKTTFRSSSPVFTIRFTKFRLNEVIKKNWTW